LLQVILNFVHLFIITRDFVKNVETVEELQSVLEGKVNNEEDDSPKVIDNLKAEDGLPYSFCFKKSWIEDVEADIWHCDKCGECVEETFWHCLVQYLRMQLMF
jgi:hypothetical protein